MSLKALIISILQHPGFG